jgi:hypothetical protein
VSELNIKDIREGRVKNLYRADLRGANLRGADLYRADLRGANLRGADLYGANLRVANLCGADLYGANLRGANLRVANLRVANLCGADLYGADLYVADLYEADLYEADLYGANLYKANLRGADLSFCKGILSFTFEKHLLIYYKYNNCHRVKAGCHDYPIEYWLEYGESIGRKQGYSKDQVNMHMAVIKLWAQYEIVGGAE